MPRRTADVYHAAIRATTIPSSKPFTTAACSWLLVVVVLGMLLSLSQLSAAELRAGAAKVDITIPVAKVATASPGLTAHLLKPAAPGGKPDFFGAAPADARFVSTSVQPSAGGKARITGNLTFNGVTRPVVLETEFYGAAKMPAQMGGQEMVGFEAETTIKRSEWGMGMGIPLVSDAVELDIVAAFVK